MYAYTWRMWHNTTTKYYENVKNGVSRCLPYSLIKCLPCPQYSGMGRVA